MANDPVNRNALYELTVNEDYNPENRVCFGYVSTANEDVVKEFAYDELSNSAIALCSDGSVHNAHGEANCDHDEGSTSQSFREGTGFRIVNYKSKV